MKHYIETEGWWNRRRAEEVRQVLAFINDERDTVYEGLKKAVEAGRMTDDEAADLHAAYIEHVAPDHFGDFHEIEPPDEVPGGVWDNGHYYVPDD